MCKQEFKGVYQHLSVCVIMNIDLQGPKERQLKASTFPRIEISFYSADKSYKFPTNIIVDAFLSLTGRYFTEYEVNTFNLYKYK